jgi:competence protein ComEC
MKAGLSDSTQARSTGHYQPLVAVVAALAAGILLDRYAVVNPRFAWGAAVALWVEWVLFLRAGRDRSAAAVLLCSVVLVGAAWHHVRWRLFSEDEIGRYARMDPRPVCVELVARASPRVVAAPPPNPLRLLPTKERTRILADAVAIRDQADWRTCSGRVTVMVNGRFDSLRAGDRFLMFGRLAAPRPLQNPGEFDFAEHARGDRVLAWLTAEFPGAIVPADSNDSGFGFARFIDDVRARGDSVLWRYLEPSQAALAEAVLLGAREHLDDSRFDPYLETGAVHILSVSGLHVGILAGFLFLFLRLGMLPRRLALILVAMIIVAYAMLTYAEPPIVRAAILVVLICVGRLAGRDVLSFNSLATAAIVVLIINPADLFRTGAQLSFLAIATFGAFGLQSIFSSPVDPLDRLIAQSRPWGIRQLYRMRRWVIGLIITSAMVWLVTLPLAMARFHLFNPIAIPLNVVMWVPTVAAMCSGFLLLVFGWFGPLASLFAWVCNTSLWALDGAVHLARDIGHGFWWVAGPDDWWLVGFYLLLAGFVVLNWPAWRWRLTLLVAWAGVAFAVAGYRALPRDTLTCTFLSVGHGCAVVVELPDGRTILYDAGHFGSPESGADSIARYLWSRGITRLDAIVISHNDADHFNAVPDLLVRVPARVVYVSPTMYHRPSRATGALREFFVRNRVTVREIAADQRFAADGPGKQVTIDVLHPPPEGVRGTDNANSIVLETTYRGRRILLTGDLEDGGLARVIELPPRDIDVLLAPHHGSAKSSPEEMAPWSRPEIVVVSGGFRGNLYPVQTTYARFGAKVLHTASVGAVQVTIDQVGMSVKPLGRPVARCQMPPISPRTDR